METQHLIIATLIAALLLIAGCASKGSGTSSEDQNTHLQETNADTPADDAALGSGDLDEISDIDSQLDTSDFDEVENQLDDLNW